MGVFGGDAVGCDGSFIFGDEEIPAGWELVFSFGDLLVLCEFVLGIFDWAVLFYSVRRDLTLRSITVRILIVLPFAVWLLYLLVLALTRPRTSVELLLAGAVELELLLSPVGDGCGRGLSTPVGTGGEPITTVWSGFS